MSRIAALHALGQSVWLDFISRELITTGELERLIKKDEVRGVTSNPTIFEQAITKTDQYTNAINMSASYGHSKNKILDDLILEDIRNATDLFLTQYQLTDGGDGFVSVEVDPGLAYRTEETLKEVRRIWEAVDRPNLMIKIPGTKEGIPAIQAAIVEGININITLIFSLERYAQVIEAYLSGLERRMNNGEAINHISSVASFFVSRIDTAVDNALDQITGKEKSEGLADLYGKAAVASARLAYQRFLSTFHSERFKSLSDSGAKVQRPLWASTSTKNPAYPDTYYVDNLIGPNTVNTLPPKTLEAFRDHGKVECTIEQDLDHVEEDLRRLEEVGISLREVTAQLEREGVDKFAQSYNNLLRAVEHQVPSQHQDS